MGVLCKTQEIAHVFYHIIQTEYPTYKYTKLYFKTFSAYCYLNSALLIFPLFILMPIRALCAEDSFVPWNVQPIYLIRNIVYADSDPLKRFGNPPFPAYFQSQHPLMPITGAPQLTLSDNQSCIEPITSLSPIK